ncbi:MULTISPECIES: Ig-like domain-containing domain [unclassified Paraflavitalea]|uniref:Ig-like domain-containing domain n=1 Tax=unclassified Paraflavitalea TaxID=2798305 RepID=UPI003D32A0BB
MKKFSWSVLTSLAIYFLSIPFWVSQSGCANMAPPLGGPKDSLPPVLMAAKPGANATNVTQKKINLVFDEYVNLDNITQNLIVSPTPKINPIVESKLKVVTITIKDTLEPNTTYTFDFGNGIRDVNENNVLKNFRYVFATGDSIDNNTYNGNVIMAETGKTDSTLIAVLHRKNDDSTVSKQKPRYITRLDKEGKFEFKNVAAGTYYLFAFKDESGTRTYTSNRQLFAFSNEPVIIGKTAPLTLYAYAEEEEPVKPIASTKGPAAKNAADKKLRYETNVNAGEQDLLKPLEISFKTTPLRTYDSTKLRFFKDSMQPIKNYTLVSDSTNSKLSLKYNWEEDTKYVIIVDKDFAVDTLGRQLSKTDTLSFKSKKKSAYGIVRLRFTNLDLSKNPVLQFVQSDAVVYSHVFTDKTFTSQLFVPGDYDLRILYDDNKNGKWDAGQYYPNRKQPEIAIPIKRKITIKANWENEIDLDL